MLELDTEAAGCEVIDFDPPLTYLRIGTEKEKIYIGYLVGSYLFYKWEGVVLAEDELPRKENKRPTIATRRKIGIIEVPPPKHILKKPELWKNVEKEEKR
jgi:hypothetical protein